MKIFDSIAKIAGYKKTEKRKTIVNNFHIDSGGGYISINQIADPKIKLHVSRKTKLLKN